MPRAVAASAARTSRQSTPRYLLPPCKRSGRRHSGPLCSVPPRDVSSPSQLFDQEADPYRRASHARHACVAPSMIRPVEGDPSLLSVPSTTESPGPSGARRMQRVSPPLAPVDGCLNLLFGKVRYIRQGAVSRHHTKHKQRFVVSVVAFASLPGLQPLNVLSASKVARSPRSWKAKRR
jgi:hypothetical protein